MGSGGSGSSFATVGQSLYARVLWCEQEGVILLRVIS